MNTLLSRKNIIIIISLLIIAVGYLIAYPIYTYNVGQKYRELTTSLPYETEEFVIEKKGSNPRKGYTVSLQAILNNDSQINLYNKELRDYRKAAESWIESKNVDINSIEIEWLP